MFEYCTSLLLRMRQLDLEKLHFYLRAVCTYLNIELNIGLEFVF